jgi:hypothetical protein
VGRKIIENKTRFGANQKVENKKGVAVKNNYSI